MTQERTPGLVLAGEHITLGWNYYESRAFIVKALVDFDAKKDLEELRQRLLQEPETFVLEVFFEKACERWRLLGMAEPVEKIHGFITGDDGHDNIDNIDDDAEWRFSDQG